MLTKGGWHPSKTVTDPSGSAMDDLETRQIYALDFATTLDDVLSRYENVAVGGRNGDPIEH